jgi:hypothetical protein
VRGVLPVVPPKALFLLESALSCIKSGSGGRLTSWLRASISSILDLSPPSPLPPLLLPVRGWLAGVAIFETGEVGRVIPLVSRVLGSMASGGMGMFFSAGLYVPGLMVSGLMKHFSSFLLESTVTLAW